MKGNRQGSLSRSITRRSDQNRKIKYCFLFCDFAGSLSKKSVRTFLTSCRSPRRRRGLRVYLLFLYHIALAPQAAEQLLNVRLIPRFHR